MSEMDRWLFRYEQMRTDPYTSIKGKLKQISIGWLKLGRNPRDFYSTNEVKFGQICEALRKSWYSYKRYRKDGYPTADLALRINRIQKALGFPMSEFQELNTYGGTEWVGEELSKEDIELKKEELASWGLDDDEKTEEGVRKFKDGY
jgi:hypothetical protein